MLVVTITNVVKLSSIEENVFFMLQRIELKEEKDKLATQLIIKYFKNLKTLKNKKTYLGYKRKGEFRDDMIMNLHYFQDKSNELEFTFPGYTKHDNIRDRLQMQMDDKLVKVKNKFDVIKKQLEELLERVT
jgi:hypothetical protein